MIHTRIVAIGTELESLAREILEPPDVEISAVYRVLFPVEYDVRGSVRHALPYSHAPP